MWRKNAPICRRVLIDLYTCSLLSCFFHVEKKTVLGGNFFFPVLSLDDCAVVTSVRRTGRDSFCDFPEERCFFFELDVLYTWTSLTYIYHHQSINIIKKLNKHWLFRLLTLPY